ncbi:MAG TPA: DNA polymerase IV, partial [Alphaproteobacteria bacterium]|nr:DNA polymerase IV [Alphaproteobacteria bacterium]
GGAPARTLARIVQRIEQEVGVNASIGLSYNKFLAKIASDLDKPRGFAVIGRAEATDFLARQTVGILWGAGRALQQKLARDGITTVAQLQQMSDADLTARYGAIGHRMALFVRGRDDRRVNPDAPAKSISAETTFEHDLSEEEPLVRILWRLSEKVSRRLKASDLAGSTVTLKLRNADFHIRTRSRRLPAPTQLADSIFRLGRLLLSPELDGTRFRLLGIGVSGLVPDDLADPLDLADPEAQRRRAAEVALDDLRSRFGEGAIGKGRGLAPEAPQGGAALTGSRAPKDRSGR